MFVIIAIVIVVVVVQIYEALEQDLVLHDC